MKLHNFDLALIKLTKLFRLSVCFCPSTVLCYYTPDVKVLAKFGIDKELKISCKIITLPGLIFIFKLPFFRNEKGHQTRLPVVPKLLYS